MGKKRFAYLQLAGGIALALVTIHGKTSRGWQDLHTIGVVLSAVAMLGPELL